MTPSYSLRLSKEDFKFSAAHFTVFGAGEAEQLHGHDYRVSVLLAGRTLDELDFLMPLASAKRAIRSLCAELDERVLLPADCPHVDVTEQDDVVSAGFGPRRYVFPAAEVLLLPVRNVTVEALARMLWRRLRNVWQTTAPRIETVEVTVTETSGQGASYRRRL